MTISIDFQTANLLMKSMAIQIERFQMFYLLKGMTIYIDFQTANPLIKGMTI